MGMFDNVRRRDPANGVFRESNLNDFLASSRAIVAASPGNQKRPPHTFGVNSERPLLGDDERDEFKLSDADDEGGADAGGGKKKKKKKRKFRPKDHQESIDFGTARTEINPLLIDMEGDFFWFKKSTNSSDVLKIRIDNEQNPFVEFLPGQGIADRRFRKIWLAWAQVVGATGSLLVSDSGGFGMKAIG
jgi:hypothetical protein